MVVGEATLEDRCPVFTVGVSVVVSTLPLHPYPMNLLSGRVQRRGRWDTHKTWQKDQLCYFEKNSAGALSELAQSGVNTFDTTRPRHPSNRCHHRRRRYPAPDTYTGPLLRSPALARRRGRAKERLVRGPCLSLRS